MGEHICDICGNEWSCVIVGCTHEKECLCSDCKNTQNTLDDFYDKRRKALLNWIHDKFPHGIGLYD